MSVVNRLNLPVRKFLHFIAVVQREEIDALEFSDEITHRRDGNGMHSFVARLHAADAVENDTSVFIHCH